MAGRAVGKVNLHCQQMVLAKNAAGFAAINQISKLLDVKRSELIVD